jgi:hypothetical protein
VLILTPASIQLQGVSGVTFMSALPNLLPSQQKKTPGRAVRPSKLNQYGRDPRSPAEQMRGQSDYDKQTGYAPFYHAFWADLCRLSSGQSCMALVGLLWGKSAGRGMRKGEARPEWTPSLRVEDLAQICRCDVRTIERELAALDKRGLAEIRRSGKGEVEARLKYRDWEALPDYRSAVLEIAPPDEAAPDLADADELKPGNQRVTGKRPVRLPAGALSKAFPVSCGVKTFRHKAEGPVDLEFSCVIQAGELLVISKFPEDWRQKVEKSLGRSNGINENTSFPRHGCREEQANVGRKQAAQKALPAAQHPRAAELNRIFDPVLAHSGASLLSMDSSRKFSLEACQKIQDCDHDYLARFVANRSKIKSVLAVPDICAEALASWRASKVLDGAGLPQSNGQKKGFADGLKAEAARRLAKYGRI